MIRVRWRGFELPNRVVVAEEKAPYYAKFVVEPFERGFGTTIGNSLRRVLLSSIEGAAVTHVRIHGVKHEFSSIDGVLEDVPDILLNVRKIRVRLHRDGPSKLYLRKKGKGEVRAGDFTGDQATEVVNTDHYICTITDENTELAMELDIAKGRGYTTAEENRQKTSEIGVIPVDSVFSPVQRVRYSVENTRVGYRTNYDRLILEIWTDGTVTPHMALVEAAKILRKHLNPFVQYAETGKELVVEERREEEMRKRDEYRAELAEKLMQPISILQLSVRASNCLEAAKIRTIKDLIKKTEAELLALRNFGKTSLREVKEKLSELGLSLGMDIAELEEMM